MSAHQAATKLLASLGMSAPQTLPEPSFNRSLLPSPQEFWAAHGVNLQSKKGWILAKCIFHEDTRPSMSVEATSGAFFCHSCGVKGGDVLAAHRLLTGCDFVTAAKALGAWEKK